jgi:uncharacterized protein (TIGR03435 family)
MRTWGRRSIPALMASFIAAPFLGGAGAPAQSTAVPASSTQDVQRLQFEVASIRTVAVDPAKRMQLLRSGQWTAGAQIHEDRADYLDMTVRQLIAEGYQVMPDQVAGPNWMGTEHFTVRCKMPKGSRKGDAPLMLQALLAERFHLVVHRDLKEQDVLALVVSERGSNLKESPPETVLGEESQDSRRAELPPLKSTEHAVGATAGTTSFRGVLNSASGLVNFTANRLTMPKLADLLTRTTLAGDRRVVDMTRLEGAYEVRLDIPMEALGMRGSSEGGEGQSGQLLQSLRDLGLDLKKAKARVEYVVVDQVERMPSAN